MSELPQSFPVLGLPVHLLDNYVDWLVARLQQGLGAHVVTLNAEMTMQAEQNRNLAGIIRHADLVIPDGSGIVLYLKMHGKRSQRCPGIELAETLLYRASQLEEPCPVFFFGGAPEVIQTAAQTWQERAPGLAIAGVQHGYLKPEEEPTLHEKMQALQPRIILVGLGVPRQELWIAAHRHLCPQAIWIGVGGSFDIWAGTKERAPTWWRDNHLEWAYRLYKEPWRWRRMLALPHFAWRALLYRFTPKRPARQPLP